MNIIYTGLFAYPDSSANTLRVQGVVNLLKELGHDIKILPGLISNYDENLWTDESVEVVSTKEYQTGIFSSVSGIRGLFVGDNTINYLEKMSVKPDIIILYGTHLGYLTRLLQFTKKYNIKLILDVVEWYDPRHLPGGVLGPFAIMNELSMRFFVKKADGIIVISEYLKKYYSKYLDKIILIPPLFEENSNKKDRRADDLLPVFCYVGTPGKKENFELLFEALDRFYASKIKFRVNFVGMERSDFVIKYQDVNFINDDEYTCFFGKVKNDKAKEIIASSDFMLVFRPNLRFSNAGFPSKIAESLSLGTSIFCNNFSDISKYVVNGYNGIIIEDLSFPVFINELNKIFSANDIEYNIMRKNAYNSFKLNFHKAAYMEKMEKFLKEVC